MALANQEEGHIKESKAVLEVFESKPRSYTPPRLERWKLKLKTLF
jgi:hypothetical protein